MKQPRYKISKYIADKSLKNGIDKKLAKAIAAYLISENRLSDLDSILRDVNQDWANEGIVEVTAVSAFNISTKVEGDIRVEVRKLYPNAKKIVITSVHDESVIAGIRLEFANQQLDLTVESKLNTFKQLAVAGKE